MRPFPVTRPVSQAWQATWRRWPALLACLLLLNPLNAQWREMLFDDGDMARDLPEALTFQKYPTYDQYLEMMQQFAAQYPGICRLDTFGTSEEGRLLLALKISDHVEADEPEARFLYTSSIHGDELVGFPLLLRLASLLLEGYGNDAEITGLVDTLSIWINPLANPDGSFSADSGQSLKNSVRTTVKGIDLNRNFPDPGRGQPDDTTGRALENRYMMQFLKGHGFTLAANLHGGDEVVNYPWDHASDLHADDQWYRFISREYADEAMAVDPDYMFGWPDDGITNGAEWFIVRGGRQDYVNFYLEGREVTLELSLEKQLPASRLEEYWNINRRSLLNFMAQCSYGIRGRVTDLESGEPVAAKIQLPGHDAPYSVVHSRAMHGDFYRLIKEGVYDLVASAPGYLSDTLPGVEVTDYSATWLDIRLERDPFAGTAPATKAPGFRLYPNPAGGMIFLEPEELPARALEIRVYSVQGQLLLHERVQYAGEAIPLHLGDLPGGFCILRVSSEGSSTLLPFIHF